MIFTALEGAAEALVLLPNGEGGHILLAPNKTNATVAAVGVAVIAGIGWLAVDRLRHTDNWASRLRDTRNDSISDRAL